MARKGEMGRKTRKQSNEKKSRSTDYKYGAGDRGSLEFKARASEQEGEIMRFAICSVMDIIDFLGGGDKHMLITRKHKGRFVVAVNDDVRELMNKKVVTVPNTVSIPQALKILQKNKQGGAPVIDDESRVVGTIAEVNFVEQMMGQNIGVTVGDTMATRILNTPPDTSIRQVTLLMVKKGYRRIPVVKDGVLIGITSASDVLRYLGSGEMFEMLVTGDIEDAINRPIRKIMKTSLVTIGTRADIGEAASVMMEKWIGSIPVVENGRLVGMLTQTDVLKHFRGL